VTKAHGTYGSAIGEEPHEGMVYKVSTRLFVDLSGERRKD